MDKGIRSRALRCKHVALAVTAAFLPSGQSYALPTGEAVVAGDVTVTRPTAQTMQINQATQKGIVNWLGFSIGASEHVNITQPNASASLLNRVVGNNPSEIFGRLTANGRVFLVNPNGVLFAPGASVDVGSLFASSLALADQDFLAGRYQFVREGNAGSVVNQGTIITANGYTGLIGPQVRNDGVIIARSGAVALAAGDRVSLDLVGDGLISVSVDQATLNASVVNTGRIEADGGIVVLAARSANALLDTVINTSGIVRANSLVERNGEIVLEGGDAGMVQVAGTVQAGGSINITAGGALNVGSTVCCFPTQITAGSETITAGSITVGGGATVNTSFGAGSQTITTPGTLLVRGGVLAGDAGFFHNGSGEQRVTAGNVEVRGGTGTNTGAFINSTAGADQTVTVTGELRITGGASGTGNRAGIVSNGNQTIAGNPNIVLTGGAGGVPGSASNNVFIQATGGETKPQTINARSIELRSGAGNDASATLNAARQVITTIGNVSLFGGAGLGSSNGVRIGGIGGSTLGPTNLTLSVGGDLLLHGGTANGASLGSSGASTQANTIAVTAGNITLESEAAGARIGTSGQVPVTPGNISVSAAGNLELGEGTAIRANGPITLTANGLVNDGTITNGGGSNNMLLSANSYDLAGGSVQGGSAAVLLRPRDGTRSFGIEAAGDPTLTNHTNITNADIASISTSNFIVFGSGTGANFTGNMTIGQDAQVNGGTKNLAFFRSATPGGTTTIGSQGVTTSGDVIVSAGGGAIVSNGVGTVAGDEVQLRASQGIGAPFGQWIRTAANALAVNNTGPQGAYILENDNVTLRTIALTVGGPPNAMPNIVGNAVGGTFELTSSGGSVDIAGGVSTGTMSIAAPSGSISESAGGAIFANTLNTNSGGATTLGGPNQISNFSGFSTGGALSLTNSGALTVSSFFAMMGDGTLVNAGDVSVTGGWNSQAAKIDTTGNLTITGSVSSNGFMEVDVDGTLTVTASGQLPPAIPGMPGTPRSASLTSLGGQDIDAGGIKVIASDGAFATIGNNGTPSSINTPAQKIVVGAGGIELRSSGAVLPSDPHSSAQISNFSSGNQEITVAGGGINVISTAGNASITTSGPFLFPPPPPLPGDPTLPPPPPPPATLTPGSQTITVTGGSGIDLIANGGSATITQNAQGGAQSITTINADHIALDGRAGLASISNFQGEQTISITGTGNNALRLGSAGGQGLSQMLGRTQSVTAGDAARGEAGRIDLVGANAPSSFVGITTSNAPGAGNSQTVSTAGTITIQGGNAVFQNPLPPPANITSSFTGITHNSNGQQTINAASLGLQGGAGINNGVGISSNQGARQQVAASAITLKGGGSGTNNTAFIISNSGGDQTVTATGGSITIIGGDGGTANRAGIVTNASQTINGNPDIVLTGGAAGNANNVSIQTTFVESPGSDTKPQTINARSIQLTSGAGIDASATLNAARQVITTLGNVSLFGGAGPGGSNGVRIGGIGGTTLGPTNLTLTVGGDLLLHGGTANGATVGSSGASTQANTIAITAGNITLESEGAAARIGSSGQVAATPGNISVTAAGDLQLGEGTAIRANGPITLTANRLVNDGTVTNGGGSDNMLLSANSYDLAGGTVQGGSAAVLLRPRDGTRSFGIEAANPTLTHHTNITNADLASISTSNFVVFGSGIGANFTGNMTIGQDAQVNGGAKNLAFFRSTNPGGTTTIGSQGVTTTGDVIVSAGGGAIVSNGIGVVAGDEVQLRASQNIGTESARVQTSANALAVFGGSAFVTEANDVALRTVALTVGGNSNVFGSSTIGTFDLATGGDLNVAGTVASGPMAITAGGALNLSASGGQDAVLTSNGGQTISAQSLLVSAAGGQALISNNGSGNQTITVSGGAGAGVDVRTSGSGLAQIENNAFSTQTLTVIGGEHVAVNGTGALNPFGPSGAGIIANGNQVISVTGSGANAIRVGSSGALGTSHIRVSGSQTIIAGSGSESGSITITGPATNSAFTGIVTNAAFGADTQTISTTGAIDVTAGSAPFQGSNFGTGIFHNRQGLQTVNAGSITLRGGTGGSNNVAFISTNPGSSPTAPGGRDQLINVSGDIAVLGSDAGSNNRATIVANNGNQTINAGGDILIRAGASGVSGTTNASIATSTVGRQQTINARNITLSGPASGGIDSFAGISGTNQVINATNNVTLTGGASGGALAGLRIGGFGGASPTPTNLTMNIGGDLVLTGGAAGNGVGLGSSAVSTQPNTISITAGGSVILNEGSGSGARIGGADGNVGGGTIAITAGNNIELNGVAQSTAIRSTGDVTLSAGGTISEGASGFVLANKLTTNSGGDQTLTGPNQVAAFSGSSTTGDVALNNSGALDVTALNAFNAALTNNGDVTVSGPWSSFGTTAITTTGVGSDLGVTGAVISNGAMNVNVAGDIAVSAGLGQQGMLRSFGGQTISGQSLSVTSNGGTARVWNTGPNAQTINVSGGAGVDVQTLVGGGFAEISADAGGNQTISVVNGDHINVNGVGGSAGIFNIGGTQTLSITGTGRNAFTVGSTGALGPSNVGGGLTQNVIAGLAGEQGSITIVGSDAQGAGAGLVSNPNTGGTQTVSTSGTISVTGGRAAQQLGNFPAGISHNGTGQQTITAAALELRGGTTGNGNAAVIGSNGGGILANAGAQRLDVSGDIVLAAGNGGDALLNGGQLPGQRQTIYARNIEMSNGAGGNNSFAGIRGGTQEIHASGDVRLTAGSTGGVDGGVRIGSRTPHGADIKLFVGEDLVLSGGSRADNSANIGSSGASGAVSNTIYIETGGSVILNSGTGSGARIGTNTAVGTGSVEVRAGADIQLNGVGQATAIRAGAVTLNAANISEASHGLIVAGTLNTTTSGTTLLTGPNQVSTFNGTASAGNLTLNNSGALTVTGINASNAALTNAGDVSVIGPWNSSSTTAITTTGAGSDLLVNNAVTSSGAMSLNISGALNVNNAALRSTGGQTITAQSVNVTAQGGGFAQILNRNFGEQAITAGTVDVQTLAGGGTAEIRNNSAGAQMLTVTGDHVKLHGLGGGSAVLFAGGNQTIDMTGAAGKSITLGSEQALGGSSIRAGGNQLITGNADIVMTGGSGPVQDGSNALILVFGVNPGLTQTINAGTLTLANSSIGGNNSVAAINAANQTITTSGDVSLTANASGGSLPGVRIGGLGGGGGLATATNLTLNVGGDLVLTGGTLANNGVGIGSTASPDAPALANNITINAPNGNVILNSGVAGSGVRIGGAQTAGGIQSGGNIAITAGGEIRLNGVDEFASIRTRDSVTLAAASITEAAQGRIIAGSLSTTTSGNTLLTGPNELSAFNGTASAGNLTLNNSGALTVTGLNASNAALTNAGDVSVIGPWNSFTTAITTTGAGSDLAVNNAVTSGGAMNVNVAGDIAVTAGPGEQAMLRSFGGQTISGRSLSVTSNGGTARVWNTGPNTQAITVSGGAGVDVQTLAGGGFAEISADAGGNQTINVVNGDHINVNGASGAAMIANFGGTQTLSITGSGANAITLGATGSLGPSQVFGGVQNVTAGAGGESGSITIVGGNSNATFTGVSSGQIIGGTQTVSTSGTLRIAGGNAPNQPPSGFSTGLFHNGSGEQRVNAANVEMQGGSSGVNNSAIIISSGGAGTIAAGHQVINAAGGNIELAGGSGGSNNTAIIVSFADQMVNAGNVELRGGAAGAGNGAFINLAGTTGGTQVVNVAGDLAVAGGAGGNAGLTGSRQQTIFANDISLTNSSAGAVNSVAFIQGVRQEIHATGNVTLIGDLGDGAGLGGVRIGGAGLPVAGPSDVTLRVGGDLLLTAGGTNNAAVIGMAGTAAGVAPPPSVVDIEAAGDVILRASDKTGVRIGTSFLAPTAAAGNISIRAGGSIQMHGLNGDIGPAVIRTASDVTLAAGTTITQTGSGRVLASGLTTTSIGDSTLTGPNQVVIFNGTSGSDLTLNNTAALNVAGVNATGTAALTAGGAMAISGPVVAGGVELTANGGGIEQAGGGSILAGSLTTFSTGDTSLNGGNQVAAFNATSTGGDVSLNNTGVLNVTGMSAFGDATITNLGTVTVSGPWTAGGTSTITVGSDILLRSAMQSHEVVLVSTTGGIDQDPGASITAETLTTSSLTDTVLDGTNVVETINVSSTQGDIRLNTVSAVLKLSGMELPGALVINNTGAIEVTGHVSALSHDLSATGDVTVGGANENGATMLYAPGFITIATPGWIRVRGSDTTAGAGSTILAGGGLTLSAGNVALMGGAAADAPAVARAQKVSMTLAGDLAVTGGSGHFSPAVVSSGSNIDLFVGGAVRIDAGSGDLSFARIQTEIREGVIHITFPNLSQGGYFVNGLEGDNHHGETGFFTLNKPAKPGSGLLLEYGI